MNRCFLFSCGTGGDLWNCGTLEGCGFFLRQLTAGLGEEIVWQWNAQRAHWDGLGGGQADHRDDAIAAACAALTAAGIDLDRLPQARAHGVTVTGHQTVSEQTPIPPPEAG